MGTSSTDTDDHKSGLRGQTEPLAALVAVMAVCLTISVYTGAHTQVLAEFQSDRDVADVTADRIWDDATDAGVFYENVAIDERVDTGTIPRGYYVDVRVTVVGPDGQNETRARQTFDPQGAVVDPPSSLAPATQRDERPIAVQYGPGDVRPGRLTVVVWE